MHSLYQGVCLVRTFGKQSQVIHKFKWFNLNPLLPHSWPALALLNSHVNGTMHKTNSSGDKLSPWKIPLLISTSNIFPGSHSKSTFVEEWKEGRSLKSKQKWTGEGSPSMCVHLLFVKKMLRFSKGSFLDILQFFLLIVMTILNIKQTIMKYHNIQSCKWMACDRFRQPFLFCRTFRSFLCTIHYFLCAFSAKMATY